jgi:hypothetical protein
MGCQYKYFFVDPFDYYGLLSHHTGERIDQVAEERVIFLQLESRDIGMMEYWVLREMTIQ